MACYDDGSVKQVCYFPPSKEVQIYRASPDVEEGCRFMRIQKFSFDFRDLNSVINGMSLVGDKTSGIIEIAMKASKRLVFYVQ